ncbi:MAG TPA: hypothetical protein VLA76_05355 [Candidatus Angelobacter sp.]|nr:hypothetical protein [Candidatus Angelobacter sp.]
MHSATFSTVARTGAVALVIAAAAALGLFVGDAISDPERSTLHGYPAGWAGGAAVPVSRTADKSFSLDAIAAVAATRDMRVSAPAAEEYLDYPLRHRASQPEPARLPSDATIE